MSLAGSPPMVRLGIDVVMTGTQSLSAYICTQAPWLVPAWFVDFGVANLHRFILSTGGDQLS